MLNKLFQDYVNLSYNQLLDLARNNLNKISADLKNLFNSQITSAVGVIIVISTCLGIDGRLTSQECQFLNDLLCTNYDVGTIGRMVDSFKTANAYETADQLADALSPEKKAILLSLCMCSWRWIRPSHMKNLPLSIDY